MKITKKKIEKILKIVNNTITLTKMRLENYKCWPYTLLPKDLIRKYTAKDKAELKFWEELKEVLEYFLKKEEGEEE